MSFLKETPQSGTSRLFFRGDTMVFTLSLSKKISGRAFLRTNIGRGPEKRGEIIANVEDKTPYYFQDWRDVPMERDGAGAFKLRLALGEVGHFEAKCFFLPDDSKTPVWPEGDNIHINVEPAEYICSNSVYCAFVRQFGRNKAKESSKLDIEQENSSVKFLDDAGFTVIPPSGTFRDLAGELDHIVDTLKCRILHLLPVNPTPTVYARMGRFGSPYAALDFFDVDPSMAEFDKKATPMDQFMELVDAVHKKNAMVFLDIAINHTGWAAKIHECHPEWLLRDKDGSIHSPGAWGVVWGDLTELDKTRLDMWSHMASVFLKWCERGVDGFRCDAGYMIPEKAWEYIIAKVRMEYPNTIFLLEGLGGDPAVTRRLLDVANMNWAYSELFQNYSRGEIESYLAGASKVSETQGLMIHYAETHDNSRLAAVSDTYAKMRTALCALTSFNGAFGFANGVEWFATEKIDVHEDSGLNWGSGRNQVAFISRINSIIMTHPAFHDNATMEFVDSGCDSATLLLRSDASGRARLLVAVNLDCKKNSSLSWSHGRTPLGDATLFHDLISGREIHLRPDDKGVLGLALHPGEVLCLSPRGDDLDAVREAEGKKHPPHARIELQRARACVLDVLRAVNKTCVLPESADIDAMAARLLDSPEDFLATIPGHGDCRLTHWEWPGDLGRDVMIPPGHFLLVSAPHRFRAAISRGGRVAVQYDSLRDSSGRRFALFPPFETPGSHETMKIKTAVYGESKLERHESGLLLLAASSDKFQPAFDIAKILESDLVFLACNGRGANIRTCVRWGQIRSRYDAVLAANLSPEFPEDRHIMFRRCRMWLICQARSKELSADNIHSFSLLPDGSGLWKFHVPAGNGLFCDVGVSLSIVDGKNAVRMRVVRLDGSGNGGRFVDPREPVSIIIRTDVEDRSFHFETKAYAGPESSFPKAVTPRADSFSFKPAPDRELVVKVSKGAFRLSPEWSYSVFMQNEADRGLESNSDIFSPGYFESPLNAGAPVELCAQILTPSEPNPVGFSRAAELKRQFQDKPSDDLEGRLVMSLRDYVVKRGDLKTVIAGYPWFLDWGRDTLICARGLIASGMIDEVSKILVQFARFEEHGTLPNIIHGSHVGNRDTSDAQLWFFAACSDLCARLGGLEFLGTKVDKRRTVLDVLASIAGNYVSGTKNGIRMDEPSGLIFSPSHFTWMDTNYPACTPRQGYPVEIQALWFAALSFLSKASGDAKWAALAEKVKKSIAKYFVCRHGWLSDCLHCDPRVHASKAVADDHLRPNQIFAVTMGAVDDPALAGKILNGVGRLVIPGAVRSLADAEVLVKQAVFGNDGTLLNDPSHPYFGKYEGQEDSSRKPAYHNGTAWTWLFPSYCEAYLKIHGEAGRSSARALLSSSVILMEHGCLGHVPEILDGDAPHKPRGCDAQAWGMTELYRVWKLLKG